VPPPVLLTTTSTWPVACTGGDTTIVWSSITITPVPAVPPKLTIVPVPERNPEPLMVTLFPFRAAEQMSFGDTEVTMTSV
jgi:hypothetical protein